ncbi:hypothetical protein POM88_043644 [Heracleum sosnowskyi]|uniref:Uncharacterized protein n=1 Tax=Heracleum sosnowskyi TaxID=360622 RepID=A0AAD8H3V9_9APIA|nr:hypothetical protein POM88_043644 [Heracleum sosnowskyi]
MKIKNLQEKLEDREEYLLQMKQKEEQLFKTESCAELPAYIQNRTNPQEFLKLCFNFSRDDIILLSFDNLPDYRCNVCCTPLPGEVLQFFYFSSDTDIYVCFKCARSNFSSPSRTGNLSIQLTVNTN